MANGKKTTSKSNGSKKATKKGGKNAKKNNKKTKKLSFYEEHPSLVMLIYFVVSLFMLAVAVIPGYNLWLTVRGFFYGTFGIGFYILIVVLFVIGIRIALNNLKRSLWLTTFSGVLFSFLFDSLIHLFKTSIESGAYIAQVKEAYDVGYLIASADFSVSGGVFGALLGGGLLYCFGKTAGILIAVVLIAVTIIVYLNISFSVVGDSVSSVINSSKDRIDVTHENNKQKRAQKSEQRKEERKRRAEEAERVALENQRNTDDFDFNKTDIELDDRFERRKKKPLKEYNPPNRLFTYVGSASNEEVDSSAKGSKARKKAPDVKKPVQQPEPDFDEPLPFGFEEVGADEELVQEEKPVFNDEPAALPDNEQSIVENALKQKKINQEKNKQEVADFVEDKRPTKEYSLPPIDCLDEPVFGQSEDDNYEINQTSKKLVDTLKSFGVVTTLIGVSSGPSVTRYELQPAPGVKISKITGLADDIALNLAASGVRIEAPIPNKSAVGIEVPNKTRSTVFLKEIIASNEFRSSASKLNVALGKDISGNVKCADIAKMPHLLIAGTTGSGKSVCLNGMIASILYKAKPDEVKLLMIDPKQVEFSVYNGIPHLLVPVISDVRKAAGSLAWAVGEMENRYKLFSACGVRDIKGFNKYIVNHPEYEFMPQIVIFIDELNDLMMISPKEVEDSICRLAQKARAAGMHLVVATQRPSVDVITGIIKANIPSRISLSVSSQVDSRTILDCIGAEKLLGNGDMLYNPVGISKPVRIQGAFLSDEEIEKIVDYIKSQEEVEYDNEVMEEIERNAVVEKKKGAMAAAGDEASEGGDAMFEQVVEFVVENQTASTTLLQRKFRLGYARAARIMDELEQKGIVSALDSSKQRKVLITQTQLLEMKASNDSFDTSDEEQFDILSDD